jgi:hypothetical protein
VSGSSGHPGFRTGGTSALGRVVDAADLRQASAVDAVTGKLSRAATEPQTPQALMDQPLDAPAEQAGNRSHGGKTGSANVHDAVRISRIAVL